MLEDPPDWRAWPRVVCLGNTAARHVGLPRGVDPCRWVELAPRTRGALVPHPSGRTRWYNDPQCQLRAVAFLRAATMPDADPCPCGNPAVSWVVEHPEHHEHLAVIAHHAPATLLPAVRLACLVCEDLGWDDVYRLDDLNADPELAAELAGLLLRVAP